MADHTYDLVPYDSAAFPQTHPDRLATVARLFGIDPPAVARCRVLELGAGTGGNLIPMAYGLPDAHFVGIDLSAAQVADGAQAIEALGLTNVTLKQMSITDVGPELGEFDYIICHGVYSWVPAPVRDAVLTIFRRMLAPNGVAYVSYNTYPGWHVRGTIRDLARYHASLFEEPAQKIGQARAVLDFLAKSAAADDPFGALLKLEVDLIAKQHDSYFFHEHLEEVNQPFYFHEVAEQVSAKELQYLADADFSTMLATNFPPAVTETLRRLAKDVIRMEQYMDFLRKRSFRASLLVHREQTLRRALGSSSVQSFYVLSSAATDPGLDVRSAKAAQFRSREGAGMSTPHPITKAAMVLLAEAWPEAIAFDDLVAAARARLAPEGAASAAPDAAARAEDARILGADLLTAYGGRIVDLRTTPVRARRGVSDRPAASPVARREARRGARVTSQRHESIELDDLQRHVVPILDGTRDRAAVVEHVVDLAVNGPLVIRRHGEPVKDRKVLRGALEPRVSEALASLAASALLVD